MMAFKLFTGAHTRDTNTTNHAKFKVKADGSGVLTFTSSGAKRLETLGLNYAVGDKVELNIDSDKSLVAFNKRDSQYSVNLSRYGKVDSRRFQIYSKKLAGEGLKEGEYRVEEPKKSQSEFDFLLYPVSES